LIEKKVPSLCRKRITHQQSGNQFDMELQDRIVSLSQQVQHSHHAEIPIQNSQAITNAPRYVTIHILRTDFNIPYVSDVIRERNNKHHNNLAAHHNPLLQSLLQPINTSRLKRCCPLDLEGTSGDIAG